MKTCFIIVLLVIALRHTLIAEEPGIKWRFDTKSFSAGMAASADIDGDGKLEIVFGCYRNDGAIYALNAENGSALWSYYPNNPPSEGCNDAAPLLYDVNSDGIPEVIVASSCTPKTICLNGKTGAIIWEENARGSDSPPTIARLVNNGKLSILHGEFGGWVRCLDAENGETLWELPVNLNSWVQTAPTIVDVNNDSQLDFVVGTWEFDNKDSLYAFDGKTRERLWAVPIHGHIYHGSAVADFDNDKFPEILVGSYNNNLYCINGKDGGVEWTYKGPGAVTCPVVTGDIDNDGDCDIVFTSWYKVIALNSSGALKWEYVIPDYSSNFRGCAIADINDDSFLDVVFGTNSGRFIALNGNDGTEIFDMNIAEDYGKKEFDINHAPLIADFDKDGSLEAFFVGGWGVSSPTIENNYGRAYMVGMGKGRGPDWLMFQRDPRRTASICYDDITKVNDNPKLHTTNIISISPDPASDYIEIDLAPTVKRNDDERAYGIKIFNTFSECLLTVEPQNFESLRRIDISSLPVGVYFITSGARAGKFVKI